MNENAAPVCKPVYLTRHRVNPANDKLVIAATDDPGAGGAYHRYEITGFKVESNPSALAIDDGGVEGKTVILFQNGPIPEKGVNGLTQEALLAIVIHRLQSFQSGPYPSRENALALTHIEQGLMWLNERTRERMSRSVEGTHAR